MQRIRFNFCEISRDKQKENRDFELTRNQESKINNHKSNLEF